MANMANIQMSCKFTKVHLHVYVHLHVQMSNTCTCTLYMHAYKFQAQLTTVQLRMLRWEVDVKHSYMYRCAVFTYNVYMYNDY